MTKTPRKNVVEIPSAAVIGPLMKQIRAIAATSARVRFSGHALEQMARRGITDMEVFRVLKTGEIVGLPWHEPEIGGRACKVVFRPRGSRAIGVVTVVLRNEELLLKTVEWEDR